MITVIIPIYFSDGKKHFSLSMNWYRNAHFFQSNKVKQALHEIIANQLQNTTILPISKYQVHYKLYYKNSNSDLSNFCSLASKWFLDTLQACKIIPNDKVTYVVREIYEVAEQSKDNPRIEATITLFEGDTLVNNT